ncbi:hypothetical protein ACNJQS_21095, partial [Mycobacterium tuberculosis]
MGHGERGSARHDRPLLVPTVDAHLANGSMSEVMMSEIAGLPIPPIIHYGAIAYAPSGAPVCAGATLCPTRR